MKTYLLITTALMLATAAKAQTGGVVVTSAPTLELGQSELSAKLTQILNEAQLQNEKLQTSLERLGEPRDLNASAITTIQEDIRKGATSLKTREEQLTMMQAIDGSEVFNDTAFGVMQPIGRTVTRDDGVEVDRDPEKYKMEAAQLAHVKEYKKVRSEAIERKKALNRELSGIIEDLNNAQDLSNIQKLQGMITALEGQLAECNATIMVAQADSEMTLKELEGQARVVIKGKQEAAYLNRPASPDAAPLNATGTFPGAGGTSTFRLPWGRRGEEGNPDVGGPAGPTPPAN